MFDRFSPSARNSIVVAQDEARSLNHRFIGTGHILLGLLSDTQTIAGAALVESGVTAADVRRRINTCRARGGSTAREPLNREALASIGIDLDAVRAALEASSGEGALDPPECRRRGRRHRPREGHIPFSARSKQVLELSVRQSQSLHHTHVGTGHLLLGLLNEGHGFAVQTIIDLHADPQKIHQEVMTRIRSAA